MGWKLLYYLIRAIEIYSYIIVLDALLSWFLSPFNKFRRFIEKVCEPVVSIFTPASNWLMRKGGLPMRLDNIMAMLALTLLAQLLRFIMSYVLFRI